MRNRIECWTAEQLLPLTGDGALAPDVAAWLEGHRARCARHARPASPPAFAVDAELQRQALERIRRSFAAVPASEPALPAWLQDLAFDWRAAPLPMGALSALSLLLALGGAWR